MPEHKPDLGRGTFNIEAEAKPGDRDRLVGPPRTTK
jgi:hypothetical protein